MEYNNWEVIQTIWKKLNVKEIEIHFDCGGDSINEMACHIFNNEGKWMYDDGYVEDGFEEHRKDFELLSEQIIEEAYENVEFHEVSGGNYIGEYGVVVVTLNEWDKSITFVKDTTSSTDEEFSKDIRLALSVEEMCVIEKYVQGFSGGQLDPVVIEYKGDVILEEDEIETLNSIIKRVEHLASELKIEDERYNQEDSGSQRYRFEMQGLTEEGIIVTLRKGYELDTEDEPITSVKKFV